MASAILNFIRGLATKKGGQEVVNVFRKNLDDTFGKDEVKEGIRIITQGEKDPQLRKLFFREGESLEDELVNLLEARYMSSERLMTHPLHFNRRGPGAAKRYLVLNDSGKKLTDLPGGPGDKSIYGKFYGDMAKTKNSYTGERVYKNERPTIFDEGTQVTDKGETIEGTAEAFDDIVNTNKGQMTRKEYEVLKAQDENPLLTGILAGQKKIKIIDEDVASTAKSVDELTEFSTEIPMVKAIMNQTGKTEKEVRKAIVDMANEAYEPGNPKLMSIQDDDRLRAFTEVKSYPGEISDFTDDVFDRLGVPRNGPALSMPPPSPGMRRILQEEGLADPLDTGDDILANMKKMEAEVRAMKEIAEAEQTEIGQGMDAFRRMLDDGEDPAEAMEFLKTIFKRTKQADGGRVGMFLGGSAIGKGIMEAAKLAQKGIKPFGQKQTYKQKVTTKGVSPDQFDEIYQKQLARVPDEVYDQATGKGLHTSLLEAEAILTGQKLGLLTQSQRSQIAKAMTNKVRRQIYDEPVSGLSNEYLEYMDDAIGRMDDIFEIERLGGDLTPKPIFDGKEIIGAQVDFTQLNKLTEKPKIDRFPNFPAGTSSDNVIPFKPREKKFTGGLAGLLKRIMSPKLEKKLVEKGPFQTGHRSDIIGDMEQIKNISRSDKSSLDDLDYLYDMVQESPRYNEAMRGAMMKLVDYERFRAILLEDNDKLQRMLKIDPEGSEEFIRMLFREGGSQPQFSTGGIVNTLAAPQSDKAYRNSLTNEDLFNMRSQREQREIDPRSYINQFSSLQSQRPTLSKVPYNITAPGHSVPVTQTSDSFERPLPSLETQMGQLSINQENAQFLQTPTGQGFTQLDQSISNLGQALGQGQQQIQEQMAQMNSGQRPISSLQSQNVLNLGGLGNLFGTRS